MTPKETEYLTYIDEKCRESYKVNGQGIDAELYRRIYLDGVKTGCAYMFLNYDELQRQKFTQKK